ncbi:MULTISPECIES: hypothetical protein [unclassified Bradyrhizobium]|uniref:hypothetical protein n=1 Tax=unclassified Bradyrhizobium TaxID=2631580 RepID=UPI00247AF9CF|nr:MULTISPECIES: hypothetical protein [unclassified Bradyrhizobium]WGR67837.1 hypothetical protein MTX24_20425 [Bradyrhizobium sp. ISRA426]WGR79890.1 hypothetical protein MTX21_05540 [Bradyrhizobium sp. ISRA430]WGR83076.1 hypothetical protein MTX25_20105 [Bradyrhizobium sp. ISRA432]
MAEFRYAREDLLKAAAERKGLTVSAYLRSLADSALASEGFPVAEQQYCLVRGGELIATSFKPAKDEDGGEWLPIENEDSQPFDPAKHWRLKPLPLRLDGDRVVRVYPVVVKSQEHA